MLAISMKVCKSFRKLSDISFLIYCYFHVVLLMVCFDCQIFPSIFKKSDKILNKFILIVVNGYDMRDSCQLRVTMLFIKT